LIIPLGRGTIELSEAVEVFTVCTQSMMLEPVGLSEGYMSALIGHVMKVRVILTSRGQKKLQVLFFYGKIAELAWDPARLS
jgi:hypothetical protein